MARIANKKNIKRLYNVVVLIALILGVCYVYGRFAHFGDVEYTDNAQVWRQITPINSRVQGYVKEIRFDDYQQVHRGDTLLIIEDSEYRLKLAQAEAGVRGSRSGQSATSAGINTTVSQEHTAQAGIEEAKANMDNARTDFERYESLLAKKAVTRQQYDDMKTRYEIAKARYEQATTQRQSTSLVRQEQQHHLQQSAAGVSVAEAQVNLAKLNLSYTVIVATCDGKIGRKTIHEGQLIQPGMQVAEIVEDDNVWVTANYRESQLKNIKVGDKVNITADAVPGVKYQGVVEVISGATGGAFSKVPVDNATGNFVKVEQRVPVRIRLTENNKAEDMSRLLAGLNVETEVQY